jgi:TP901-1 family phage major tail protein
MKRNGTEVLLYVLISSTPTAIGSSIDNSLSINGETIDVTTKDSAGWKEAMAGVRSWSVKGSGVFDDADSFGFDDLKALVDAKVPVTVRISTEASGDTYQQGEAIITSLELTAPMEDKVGFSYSFDGSGPLESETV